MSQSEVAEFRQRQAVEEESAYRALYEPAAVASHEAINARMCAGANQLVQLFEQGLDDEAYALWNAGILEGKVAQ
jgi:hypothetical protein